jgi:DNA-binding CsgD family transcriptional regulator
MRVHVAAGSRWLAEGLAATLRRAFGDAVGCVEGPGAPSAAPAAPIGRAGDVLVVAHADAVPEAWQERAGDGVALLWIGADPPEASGRALGRLPADADDARLEAAVRALACGLDVRPATDRPAGRAASLHAPVDADTLDEPLTARELEVLGLVAEGLANRDVASALGISPHTVKFHVGRILEKTGSATRVEAVRRGLRLGLIGL